MIDQMGEYRCNTYLNCRGIEDSSAPLAEQAAAAAAVKAFGLPVTGFVEDGSFLELREVAVQSVLNLLACALGPVAAADLLQQIFVGVDAAEHLSRRVPHRREDDPD